MCLCNLPGEHQQFGIDHRVGARPGTPNLRRRNGDQFAVGIRVEGHADPRVTDTRAVRAAALGSERYTDNTIARMFTFGEVKPWKYSGSMIRLADWNALSAGQGLLLTSV